MQPSFKEQVSKTRRLLGNPYALSEYLDDSLPQEPQLRTGDADHCAVINDRKRLEDPYAHQNDVGGFSATTPANNLRALRTRPFPPAKEPLAPKQPSQNSWRLSEREIARKVEQLHKEIWANRRAIWDGQVPNDPVDLLDPLIALNFKGYKTHIETSLGEFHDDDGFFGVAGIIDQSSKTVWLADSNGRSILNFTAAHELGHAILHQSAISAHRDRPLDGGKKSTNPTETEANRFATLFLMPEKLVKDRFLKCFGTEQFRLDNDTAHSLFNISLIDAQEKTKTIRDLSRALANANIYGSRRIEPLSSQFHVSVEAMAIRIEELSLIDFS